MNKPRRLLLLIFTVFFSLNTGAFLYDYYVHNRILPVQLVNESVLIEQALGNISTCTPDDRARQRSLLTTLHAWTRLAHKYNIQYWIAYGTLVGYVQRRGLLPHDDDVDILMMGEDTSLLATLANSSATAFDTDAYILKVHPQWSTVERAKRSYFRSKGINFIAPNARFVSKKTNLHVDIYPTYDYHPNRPKDLTKSDIPMLTCYDVSYNWGSLPMNWTFPLRPCQFSTLNVWCPAQPKKIVTAVYGQLSTSLSYKTCIKGAWADSQDYALAQKTLG